MLVQKESTIYLVFYRLYDNEEGCLRLLVSIYIYIYMYIRFSVNITFPIGGDTDLDEVTSVCPLSSVGCVPERIPASRQYNLSVGWLPCLLVY